MKKDGVKQKRRRTLMKKLRTNDSRMDIILKTFHVINVKKS